MGIIVNLDVMMAKRKMSLTDLAAEVDTCEGICGTGSKNSRSP